MTTNTLVTIELVKMVAAYLLLVCVPPAIVFSEKLIKDKYPYVFRMMVYFITGQIFIINLVLYLNFLNLCNRFTLILFTVLFYSAVGVYLYQIPIRGNIEHIRQSTINFGSGYLGRKTMYAHVREKVFKTLHRFSSGTIEMIYRRPLEVIGFVGTIVAVLYIFATNDYKQLGYMCSDLPFHTYWVNSLAENNPYIAAQYPLGYHCIVSYIYQVTGIKTYVLLRHWNVMIMLLYVTTIMCFVGYICKKYTCLAYFAVLFFALTDIFYKECFTRFLYGVPQEYGAILVLPTLMFLMEYFKRRESEEEGRWSPATCCRLLFSAGLACTLFVHFYATFTLFFFCFGLALTYIPVIIKKCFKSLVKSVTLGVCVALVPIMICIIGGGSLDYAVTVAKHVVKGDVYEWDAKRGSGGNGVIADLTDDDYTDDVELYEYMKKNGMMDENMEKMYIEAKKKTGQAVYEPKVTEVKSQDPFFKRVGIKVSNLYHKATGILPYVMDAVYDSAKENMFFDKPQFAWTFYLFIGILLYLAGFGIYGVVCHLENAHFYVAFAIGNLFLWINLAATSLHIPAMMDANRTRVYLIVMPGISIALALNTILSGAFYKLKKYWMHAAISALLVLTFLVGLIRFDLVKEPVSGEAQEYNGNIICLECIMRENEDFTYTVVSANDETHMVAKNGYHYEVISFLKRLHEFDGGKFSEAKKNLEDIDDGDIYIPTEKVYIFIEKIPKLGSMSTEGFEQSYVSEEGAAKRLITESSMAYMHENRWVCMSKMYYWAQEYQKLIPDDMRVYYEDANFICYEITQNVNHIYNLSIDYGYNDCGEGKMEIDD